MSQAGIMVAMSKTDIIDTFRTSFTAPPTPKKNERCVKFAPERDSINISSIDRAMKAKYGEPEKKKFSCSSLIKTTLTVLIGIIIFPLGLYWLLADRT